MLLLGCCGGFLYYRRSKGSAANKKQVARGGDVKHGLELGDVETPPPPPPAVDEPPVDEPPPPPKRGWLSSLMGGGGGAEPGEDGDDRSTMLKRHKDTSKVVQHGLTLASALLSVGSGLPLVGELCSAVQGCLGSAEQFGDKAEDVTIAARRVCDVLDMVQPCVEIKFHGIPRDVVPVSAPARSRGG